jgi:SAM-dependent methyltransferase
VTLPPLSPNAWLRWELIRKELEHRRPASILELGMGMGALATRLEQGRRYVGVEPDEQSRAIARARLSPRATVVTDLSEVDSDDLFDVVCAFEVLEHIEDDTTALKSWGAHLTTGGALILSVPAHQRRFGPTDELAGHFRRYERDELEGRLRDAGLEPDHIDAIGMPLGFLLEWGRNRLAERTLRSQSADTSLADRTASSGRIFQPPQWAGPAVQVATAPFRKAQLPFRQGERGNGWVVVARRPG